MEKVTTFRTTDGKEFFDEISAAKHEELITLKNAYKKARLRYISRLACAEKTIDGVSFAGKYHTYCYIQEFMGMPHLVDFSFSNDREFDIDDQTDELVILQPWTDGTRGYTQSKISDLYYDREAAEKALVLAQVEFLKRQADKLGLSIVSPS